MANKQLFKPGWLARVPKADTVNEANGLAHAMAPENALAQYAATGCLNHTFYASAQTQLGTVLGLCDQVEPEFIARVALHARSAGKMKDLPALLCAVLSIKSPGLMAEIFDRVIDSPKQLRNFVQIMRSGAVGRRSLGSLPKRMVRQWIESRSDEQLFNASIGNDPSLADIIKMVHPKPHSPGREAMLGYLIGQKVDFALLPESVRAFEAFKRSRIEGSDASLSVPDVPFQKLSSLSLTQSDWQAIAKQASWQTTRMNLLAFHRHGVFEDEATLACVASKLKDPDLIRKANVLPHQLQMAHGMAIWSLPHVIVNALEEAMELALANVPAINGRVCVFPDVSGSMHTPVTGYRKGASSKVRCIDVAALVSAAMLKKNPFCKVIPFEWDVVPPKQVRLDAKGSVLANAKVLASLPSGGTDCSAPLRFLNKQRIKVDLLVYVSDNESWLDTCRGGHGHGVTGTMAEWAHFKRRNPKAKMVCIDLQPYGTVQAPESEDIIHVGGFSDQVFHLIAAMANGQAGKDHWVRMIESINL